MNNNDVILINLGGFEVHQRTSDGYFSATQILMECNKKYGAKKKIAEYLKDEQTKEFMSIIGKDLDKMYHTTKPSKNEYGGTWMNPILFLHFCFWLSPKMEYNLIKECFSGMTKKEFEEFMNYCEEGYDSICTYLIKDKKQNNLYKIGITKDPLKSLCEIKKDYPYSEIVFVIYEDCEKEMHEKYAQVATLRDDQEKWFYLNSDDLINIYERSLISVVEEKVMKSMQQLDRFDIVDFAKALNRVMFEQYGSGVGDPIASPKRLQALKELQDNLAFYVDQGLIKTFNELINAMKKINKLCSINRKAYP